MPRKPAIAFLTPLPPDPTGIADFSVACLQALAKHAEIHVYTDSMGAVKESFFASLNHISPEPYISGKFDAVVATLGNSSFHAAIFDVFMKYGGISICHDARMIDFYIQVMGREAACVLASEEMRRSISWEEILAWQKNQAEMPILFLSEIVRRSSVTILHSKVTQKLIGDLYGLQTAFVPNAAIRAFPTKFRTTAARHESRTRLGVKEFEFLICSFGAVAPDKAPEQIIRAVAQMKDNGYDIKMFFVGPVAEDQKIHLMQFAREHGVGEIVRITDRATESNYREFLLAADIGMQFRTYPFGGLSGALLDCMSAGLPTVSNRHLAKSSEAPPYVREIGDGIASDEIAEAALALLADPGLNRDVQREEFLATHNMEVYAEELLKAIDIH